MRTYEQFVQKVNIEQKIDAIAALMIESKVDPGTWLLEYCGNRFDAVTYETMKEGFGDMLGNAWQAAKGFAQGAWNGGGIKAGIGNAKDAMNGPKVKYQQATQAVQALVTQLQANPQFSAMQGASGGSIVDELQNVLKTLQAQADAVNRISLQTTKTAGPTTQQYGQTPAAPAAPTPPAAPAPAPAPSAP